MQAALVLDGTLFVRDLPKDKPTPSFLRKAKQGDWYWSSWWWLPQIRVECKEWWKELDLRNREIESSNRSFAEVIARSIEFAGEFKYHESLDTHFRIPLWKGQKRAAMLMSVAKRFYLADDVGLGKTLSAIGAFVVLKATGRAQTALVVTTSSVKYQWRLEILNALQKDFWPSYAPSVIDGAASKRDGGYNGPEPIKIVSYESFRNDQESGLAAAFKPDVVILDEAWKIKSRATKARHALKAAFKDTKYKFALNASPVGNGYEEVYGIFDFLDPSVFINWSNFKDRYCRWVEIRPRNKPFARPFSKLIGYKRVPELKEKIKPMLMRRTVADMGWESPKTTVTPYWVELSKEQRTKYSLIQASNDDPLVKTTAARIACLKDNPTEKSCKYLQLLELLTEGLAHEKVIVFCESKQYLVEVLSCLKRDGIHTSLISGEDSSEDRTMKQANFTTGKIRVLLMTAAGEAGLNLQAADVVVNLDLAWNPERLRQRVGRLRPHLGGSARHIRVINILAKNTIEQRVVDVIQKKIGNFARLFEGETVDFMGVFEKSFLATLL